jgi:hypothetical protein
MRLRRHSQLVLSLALKARSLILVPLAALLVAGCGGTDNDPAAVSLVKNAFARPIGSAIVNVDFGANLQGSQSLKGPVSLKLSGPYTSNGRTRLPSFDWNIALSGGGANFDGRLTSTGDNLYLGFQGQSYDIGKATIARYNEALAQGKTTQRKSLRDFGVDPAGWIKGAKDEGDATVAGTQTKHVSASIDFDKLLNDLNSLIRKAGSSVTGARPPAQLTPAQRKQFTEAIKSSSFDVYVGKADGKVRRLALAVEFAVPKSRQSSSAGLKGGTLNISIQYSNVGQPQKVTAPANTKPLSDLLGKLGGAASLGGSSGSGGTSSGASPSSKQFQAYSKCLDSAPSGDVNALQRCSQLLK